MRPHRKEPLFKRWQELATSDPQVLADWWLGCPEANTGVPCGEANGFWAFDIDVDKKGEASLAELERRYGRLPATVEQHTGSGGRHILFRYSGEPIQNGVGRLGPGLDVRSNGGYILVPESTHPNGQPYFWDPQGHPDHVEPASGPEWLVELLTTPTGKGNGSSDQPRGPTVDLPNDPLERAALLIGTAPPGQQEETLNREVFNIGLQVGAFLIDRNRAERDLLDAAKQMKNQAGRRPWSDEELQGKIKRALDGGIKAVQPELAELNRRHFVVPLGRKTVVVTERDPQGKPIPLRETLTGDFRELYQNRFVNGPDSKKPPRLGDWWLNHRHRRQYEGIVFDPNGQAGPHLYNLWRGFAVKPRPGDWSLLQQHILDNICCGNRELYDYLLGWMAHGVQRPAERPGVAPVLRGLRGTGKGIFVNAFGKLFGDHYVPTSHANQLTGRFNSHLGDKLLIFADEAFWAGDKAGEGVLKALITEDTITIEAKFQDVKVVRNYVRLIIASNEAWVVPAGLDERRFFVLDVSHERAQDHEYFRAIVDQLENGGYEAMLYDLLNLDISGFNVRRVPDTQGLRDQKALTMTPVEEWWEQILEVGLPFDKPWGEIESHLLYEDYGQHEGSLKVRYPFSPKKFAIELRRLVPSAVERVRGVRQADGKRPYLWRFPPLAECREHWDKLTRTHHDWPDADGAREGDDQEMRPGFVPLPLSIDR